MEGHQLATRRDEPPLVRGSPEGRRTAALWPQGVTGLRGAAP